MATPIAPTPELTGRAAEKFLEDLANMEKASPERIQLMKERARQVEKILTFDFSVLIMLDQMKMKRVNAQHVFKPFDCGDQDLNDFLLNDSKLYLKNLLAVDLDYQFSSIGTYLLYLNLNRYQE